MTGKNKCKLLKEIRQKIADENDISYVTTECKFKGECTGTCPKCEAEVRYLEQELEKRRKAGKAVAVAGIAAAMLVSATGCEKPVPEKVRSATDAPTETCLTEGSIAYAGSDTVTTVLTEEVELLEGDVPMPTEEVEIGEVSYTTQPTEELILTGDVAWPAP